MLYKIGLEEQSIETMQHALREIGGRHTQKRSCELREDCKGTVWDLFDYHKAKLAQKTIDGAMTIMKTDRRHWCRAYFG